MAQLNITLNQEEILKLLSDDRNAAFASIPDSRAGVREALEALELSGTRLLPVCCHGVSLSDQYWICPAGATFTWEDVNFFQHDFSEEVGDILFGERKKANGLNLCSPDNTTDGNLKKDGRS